MLNLTFYAARHTWATLAENSVGIDGYTVHQCLNHSDEKMKITGRYIKTDWRPINRANRKVLDFLASGVEVDEDA
jgi:integrase